MRTFIFALAAIVVHAVAIDRARATDDLPEFNITRNCNKEIGTTGIGGVKPCDNDEIEAKNQLAKRWSSYGASQKEVCVRESSEGGEKSYVELLTCLEMARDVRTMRSESASQPAVAPHGFPAPVGHSQPRPQ